MLSFENANNSLSILVNGNVVYTFKSGNVLLYAGNGNTDFTMSRGSFKIKEKLKNEEPLTLKSVNSDGKSVQITLSKGSLLIECHGDDVLKFTFSGLEGFNRFRFDIPATADESVYGCGENFTEFNLRGEKVNIWVAEHINAACVAKKLVKQFFGIRNSVKKQKFSSYETYYSQPVFLSSRKYFFFSQGTGFAQLDFRNKAHHTVKMCESAPFYIGFGADFAEVMKNLTEITGRQPALPDWVYDGEILGIQGGTEVMLKKVDTALSHSLAVNGVWIQDWEGRRVTAVGKQLFWNWQYDEELYPGLPEKIKELNSRGIKVLGYCNPFLAVEKPLYKQASENGYCVKDAQGKDYYVKITTFPAAMVDLTNPEAYAWLKDIIKKNMIDFGLSGWMADFGEYLPCDCVLHNGKDPKTVHNTWPAIWAKLNREAVEESGKTGEIMFFTRAGFSETPRYSTMMWNGDNHVDFSADYGLPSVIPAMLSLTCSGFGLSHSDIGGYTTFMSLRRSEELFMRWCEMNAFSPLLRGHEGLNPDLNAQFDASETVLSHGAKMSNIHRALKTYLRSAVEENAKTGMGVVRPLFFHYDEKDAYLEGYEYLLGRDILVCPVLFSGAVTREVYLPNDSWIHLESKKEYRGGRYTVSAKIGEIPVFVRKNAAKEVLDTVLNLF